MARKNLGEMLVQAIEPNPTPTLPTHTPEPAAATDSPRYLQLTRKETRLTDAQIVALATLSRRLNKHRNGAGERITENTLIRIAVDLLLQHQDTLQGTTEDALRDSVTTKLPH